jgi:predicted nucleic acid-binding protein
VSECALVDTGYWIALFDPREEHHARIVGSEDLFDLLTLVFPWPLLYEILRTRFVRRRDWVARLDAQLKKPHVVLIDDSAYCEEAYSLAVEYATRLGRPISMVDMLCRLLLADPNLRIEYLFTVNPADFHDVCRSCRVEML